MTLRSAGKNFLYGQFHEKLTRNLFDICLRLLPVFSMNGTEDGGGECQRSRYVTEGGAYC